MSEPQRPSPRITASTDGDRDVLPVRVVSKPAPTSRQAGGLPVDGVLTEDLRPRSASNGPGQGVGSPTVVLCVLGDDESQIVTDLTSYGTVEVHDE